MRRWSAIALACGLVTGLLCAVVAIPLLMQLRRSAKYRRYIDGQGNPIDPKAMVRATVSGGISN